MLAGAKPRIERRKPGEAQYGPCAGSRGRRRCFACASTRPGSLCPRACLPLLAAPRVEEHDTKIRAINARGDESPEEELTDGILDQLAKFERSKTAERTRRGKLQKARSATRRTAADKLETIRRRAERLEGLEQDRDALMEFYAGAVPEDLERLGPEERRRIYGIA
jgi:hypothetical protein